MWHPVLSLNNLPDSFVSQQFNKQQPEGKYGLEFRCCGYHDTFTVICYIIKGTEELLRKEACLSDDVKVGGTTEAESDVSQALAAYKRFVLRCEMVNLLYLENCLFCETECSTAKWRSHLTTHGEGTLRQSGCYRTSVLHIFSEGDPTLYEDHYVSLKQFVESSLDVHRVSF